MATSGHLHLIQRQMNATDCSVDRSGVELLTFEVSAYRMLTSRDPFPDQDGLDWGRETQHVFRDNLRRAALRLVEGCGDDLAANAVFWTRLVGYAYLCAGFVGKHGSGLGFTAHPVDVAAMMERAAFPLQRNST